VLSTPHASPPRNQLQRCFSSNKVAWSLVLLPSEATTLRRRSVDAAGRAKGPDRTS
jgi:hypothetical protein